MSQYGFIGFLLQGTYGFHHVDLYWQCYSENLVVPSSALLNRLDERIDRVQSDSYVPISEISRLDACVSNLKFLWLYISVAAKYLARDCKPPIELEYLRTILSGAANCIACADDIVLPSPPREASHANAILRYLTDIWKQILVARASPGSLIRSTVLEGLVQGLRCR
jgi:hypothetical protein